MTGVRRPPAVQPYVFVRHGGRKLDLPQVGDPKDPRGMTRLVLAYLDALAVKGFSPQTVRTHRNRLRPFLLWCDARRLTHPNEVTVSVLERYQRYLHQYRKKNGETQSMSSQQQHLCTVRHLFRWFVRKHFVLSNPAADLELPKVPQQLPMMVLSAAEAERVLAQPDVETPLGLRDRALLEFLYSTGVRRAELVHLNVDDIDFARGVANVHAGKGNKDRVVPVGERALRWVQRYIDDVRPHYLFGQEQPALWVNYAGMRVGENYIGIIVRSYVLRSKVSKTGSCHLFRHTIATLMLENGADIRFIQAMLGHANLQTTQIYTRVSIAKLKEVHTATHPAQLGHERSWASADTADGTAAADADAEAVTEPEAPKD